MLLGFYHNKTSFVSFKLKKKKNCHITITILLRDKLKRRITKDNTFYCGAFVPLFITQVNFLISNKINSDILMI